MSTSPVSASNQLNLAAVFAPAKGSPRHGGGDSDSSGNGNSQGITLLASLLQALTQAASAPTAATTASASTTTTAAGAPAAAGATSATGAAAATSTGAAGGTSSSSLASDLQTFLHDLSSALRNAGKSGHGGGRGHRHEPLTTASSTATPAASTTTPASSTVTQAASATTAAGSTTPAAANPGIGAYGQRGIISELKALVQDLSNSQALSSSASSSGVPPRVLSNLNSAFEKLIGDLNGTASAPSSTSTAGGTTASASAAASSQSTSALQSFLTNFAQDLQNNGANSLNPVGSSVNTTA
jgi:hypothetical protein